MHSDALSGAADSQSTPTVLLFVTCRCKSYGRRHRRSCVGAGGSDGSYLSGLNLGSLGS